ncbi:hypothetical protein [Plantactinospora sp. GCM10030261]|uniref:hypothetical protein n=1 Tax=Plantactinospora sp. GCM10030261 TaxID=3273420 RepID=UPI00360B4419
MAVQSYSKHWPCLLPQESLDALGIAWRMNRPTSLSVARREAVAALNRYVGPKT